MRYFLGGYRVAVKEEGPAQGACLRRNLRAAGHRINSDDGGFVLEGKHHTVEPGANHDIYAPNERLKLSQGLGTRLVIDQEGIQAYWSHAMPL